MRRLTLALIALALSLPLFATEANPTARQRELVGKLMDLTRSADSTRMMVDAVFGQIEKQFLDEAAVKGNHPDDIAEAKEAFALFRQKAAKIDIAGLMKDAHVRIYSKYFSEKELEDLIAFYTTPTGKKSIQVLPDLTREGMEAAAREVSPKIAEAMNEAMAEGEKKHPWRRTMQDIRSVSTALEAYAIDHDEKYPTGEYESLRSVLSPEYIKKMPEKDMWGNGYAYAVSNDRTRYRLVSAGSDAIFEWDSRRVADPKKGDDSDDERPIVYRDRLEDDLIYEGYGFVQLPVQAKPRTKG